MSGVSDGASQYHRLMPNEVTELVARLWPGRAFEVVPLSSGITNANFMVDLGDDQVVVRIPGEHTELLGIDRRQESAANRLAASIGIAPPVLAESAEEGSERRRVAERDQRRFEAFLRIAEPSS